MQGVRFIASTAVSNHTLTKLWVLRYIQAHHGSNLLNRVVNIAILKVLQYYWQYFFEYCLHIANTFPDLVLLPVLQYFFLTLYCNTNGNTFHFFLSFTTYTFYMTLH